MAKVIIEGLNTILLALTPIERWQAARQLDSYFTAERWFTLITVAVLISLIALFLWVSYKRAAEERKIAERLFVNYAERVGLSAHERQILLEVVRASRLKRKDAIFTLKDAFDRGATRLIEQSLSASLPSTLLGAGFARRSSLVARVTRLGEGRSRSGTGHQRRVTSCEENERLRADLSFLREKLGFLPPNLAGLPAKPKRLSSRQIPVGRELHITPCKTRDSAGIESTVIKNDDMELTLKLARPLKSELGEYWRARFYFSASAWEFDSSVLRCEGDILVLNHSDNVRFINLRRFLRVPVNRPAFVARFPFTTPLLSCEGENGGWGPPEFVPAVVTELAGLSLRLDVPLEVKIGERVLVIFKSGSKIMEDVASVRHTQAIKNGFSIAAELIGLSDSDVNELVCATNAAAQQTEDRGQRTENRGQNFRLQASGFSAGQGA